MKQPSAGKYLANIFCPGIFVNFLKILAVHQTTFQKFSESSQKNTHGKVLF